MEQNRRTFLELKKLFNKLGWIMKQQSWFPFSVDYLLLSGGSCRPNLTSLVRKFNSHFGTEINELPNGMPIPVGFVPIGWLCLMNPVERHAI